MALDDAWAIGMGVQFDVMGVPATVTRPAPNDTPVTTSLIWIDPTTRDEPGGGRFQRRDRIKMAAFPSSGLVDIPRGSRVVAPETQGASTRVWKVDGTDRVDVDQIRVVVMLDPDQD